MKNFTKQNVSLCSVAMHFEKIKHFEKIFQSVLNFGPNQRTLKFFFKVRLIWDQLDIKNFSKCVKSLLM